MEKDINSKNYFTDAELVQLSLINREYFSVIVKRYEDKLRRYIKRITHVSDEDEDDIIQNVFIKTFINLASFNKKLSFNSWIYRIAHNEIIDWSRKKKVKNRFGYIDHSDEIFDWIRDTNHFLDDINLSEDISQVEEVLSHIDIKYREVIYLKFFENYSYREISDILKKPEGTVATLINRAKNKFKENYEKYIK